MAPAPPRGCCGPSLSWISCGAPCARALQHTDRRTEQASPRLRGRAQALAQCHYALGIVRRRDGELEGALAAFQEGAAVLGLDDDITMLKLVAAKGAILQVVHAVHGGWGREPTLSPPGRPLSGTKSRSPRTVGLLAAAFCELRPMLAPR